MTLLLYIFLGIALFFTSIQLIFVVIVKWRKGKNAPVLGGKAGRLIKSGERALFYFYSPGCRACLPMTPVIKEFAKNNNHIFPIDVGKDISIARKFKVMGTPSTVLVNEGVIQEFLVGYQSETKIKNLIS